MAQTALGAELDQSFPSGGDALIVDDDQPIRKLVRHILKRLGIEAREAANGAEALEMIADARPRVVFLDLMMPQMNGWDVLDALEREGILPSLPIIVLTAVDSSRTEGLPARVRAVLTKPFEVDELIRTTNEILDDSSSRPC